MAEDYATTTRGVRVSVRSFFMEDQSQPDDGHYVWAYRVKIENRGREPVQLMRRRVFAWSERTHACWKSAAAMRSAVAR